MGGTRTLEDIVGGTVQSASHELGRRLTVKEVAIIVAEFLEKMMGVEEADSMILGSQLTQIADHLRKISERP